MFTFEDTKRDGASHLDDIESELLKLNLRRAYLSADNSILRIFGRFLYKDENKYAPVRSMLIEFVDSNQSDPLLAAVQPYYKEYLQSLKTKEIDEFELQLLAKLYGIKVILYSSDPNCGLKKSQFNSNALSTLEILKLFSQRFDLLISSFEPATQPTFASGISARRNFGLGTLDMTTFRREERRTDFHAKPLMTASKIQAGPSRENKFTFDFSALNNGDHHASMSAPVVRNKGRIFDFGDVELNLQSTVEEEEESVDTGSSKKKNHFLTGLLPLDTHNCVNEEEGEEGSAERYSAGKSPSAFAITNFAVGHSAAKKTAGKKAFFEAGSVAIEERFHENDHIEEAAEEEAFSGGGSAQADYEQKHGNRNAFDFGMVNELPHNGGFHHPLNGNGNGNNANGMMRVNGINHNMSCMNSSNDYRSESSSSLDTMTPFKTKKKPKKEKFKVKKNFVPRTKSLIRQFGTLKFFDATNNFGFLVQDSDQSDVFIHYDDIRKYGISKKLLKLKTKLLRFSYHVMVYEGRGNSRRQKAIDIKLEGIFERETFKMEDHMYPDGVVTATTTTATTATTEGDYPYYPQNNQVTDGDGYQNGMF